MTSNCPSLLLLTYPSSKWNFFIIGCFHINKYISVIFGLELAYLNFVITHYFLKSHDLIIDNVFIFQQIFFECHYTLLFSL